MLCFRVEQAFILTNLRDVSIWNTMESDGKRCELKMDKKYH